MSWNGFRLHEVRKQYIGNLETAISYIHNLVDSEYRNNDNLKDSINTVSREIGEISNNDPCYYGNWGNYDDELVLFDSLDMFYDVEIYPERYDNLLIEKQNEFFKKGREYMNKLLLKLPLNSNCSVCHKIDLSVLNCDILPFILTRSIYNSELELWEGLMEYYNILEHNSRLSSQLSYLKDDLSEVKDKLKDNKKIKKFNLLDFQDELSMEEIKSYGFPKTKIILDIKEYLNEITYVYSRDEKIKISRNLFRYMYNDYVKKFINSHEKFNCTIKLKLEELCYNENLREAKVWYRSIFGKRMPVIEDTKYRYGV